MQHCLPTQSRHSLLSEHPYIQSEFSSWCRTESRVIRLVIGHLFRVGTNASRSCRFIVFRGIAVHWKMLSLIVILDGYVF